MSNNKIGGFMLEINWLLGLFAMKVFLVFCRQRWCLAKCNIYPISHEINCKVRVRKVKECNIRDWSPKFATGLNMIIGCSSKSIWLTRLLFCQNDSSMKWLFWHKNSLITHILFEPQPIIIFSPVANFGDQSLCKHSIMHKNMKMKLYNANL